MLLDRVAALPPRAAKVGEALPEQALPTLARLGALDLLNDPAHARVPEARAAWWGTDEPLPWRGWLLDRARFEAGLLARTVAAGAAVRPATRVAGIDRCGREWRLVLHTPRGERRVAADWLVDATGRNAALARHLGRRRRRGGRLVAAWASLPAGALPTLGPSGRFLVQGRAASGGWRFAARLRDRVSCQAAARGPREAAASLRAWLGELGLAGGGPPAVTLHAAHDAWLEPSCGDGWIAVGDAACAFDPLAGYGITFALGTAWYAARVVAASASSSLSRPALDAYRLLVEDRRRRVLAGLAAAYAEPHSPLPGAPVEPDPAGG
jgi:flavin-dependent dehydrogenase